MPKSLPSIQAVIMSELSNILFVTTVILALKFFPTIRPLILCGACYILSFAVEPFVSEFDLPVRLTVRITILSLRISLICLIALYYNPTAVRMALLLEQAE
jgi:hypothetical protein